MDTLTHALSGALAARAATRSGDVLTQKQRSWAGAIAAAFPDLDYILNWVSPLTYLNWHRGPTHSLVLLPLWALLLGLAISLVSRRRDLLRPFVIVSAIGLLAHIAGDVITVYGTRVLYPVSDSRLTLSTTFIIDPLFSAIIVLGLVLARFFPSRTIALAGLVLLVVYVGMQRHWHDEARALAVSFAEQRELPPASAYALPQPMSPLNWKLVVVDGDRYHESYLSLRDGPNLTFGVEMLRQVALNYRPPERLSWSETHRYGNDGLPTQLIRRLWRHRELDGFRQFAVFPAFLRIDREDGRECMWFTDLRFVIGGLIPPFRYGLCQRFPDKPWQLERLRRRSENARLESRNRPPAGLEPGS